MRLKWQFLVWYSLAVWLWTNLLCWLGLIFNFWEIGIGLRIKANIDWFLWARHFSNSLTIIYKVNSIIMPIFTRRQLRLRLLTSLLQLSQVYLACTFIFMMILEGNKFLGIRLIFCLFFCLIFFALLKIQFLYKSGPRVLITYPATWKLKVFRSALRNWS